MVGTSSGAGASTNSASVQRRHASSRPRRAAGRGERPAPRAEDPRAHDSTVYGTSRASPRSYFGHHLAAISASVVLCDANTLVNHGAALNLTLTIPSLVPNVRAGSFGARHA